MSELKRKLIEETTKRINDWSEYDDMLYDYNKTDAINFLKRLSVGIYDNVIKNTYWFGYKITANKLISWDKARKKNKSLSNITEENYLVFAEMHALIPIRNLDIDWNKVSVYIYRIKKSNKNGFGMARPCLSCMGLIKELGIKEINYTTEDGFANEIIYKK